MRCDLLPDPTELAPEETKNFEGTKTVGDFVIAGGSDGNPLFDNCHQGAEGASSYNYDLSRKSDLTKLYNSPVYLAERMKRPLANMGVMIGPISHSGVRVTLSDGSTWLVHKGNGFGVSSQTVVVDARHMSNKWQIVETKNFGGTKKIADFVRAGGTDYSLLFNNCHFGADQMMKQ
ncbi:hypothetical protein NHX12_016804 [Muraenolepis orangiensis]|uniref:Uncharacterized protein n=1 Tax=Muraenolepis orangiensis TaxID=630683 RepID=A0A9Q0D3T3_9TELE|nr:hypothetical protein NHX12_016804 [Muraenolepis orangiensis]